MIPKSREKKNSYRKRKRLTNSPCHLTSHTCTSMLSWILSQQQWDDFRWAEDRAARV
ncbi:hypothetical protein COLO4_04299 [Corchorus olitorius]|uniref:Uncharacterized protein n=1 Tax=Corchorus olitorius TaxID=93759 RepID=A0A1R3KUH5_9ROSI|nr:hypothetical protein COLO4_04299 [Corchorus olitorius]